MAHEAVTTSVASESMICARCVMDTSDPEIHFDQEGVCNHCRSYDEKEASMPPFHEGRGRLAAIATQIRREGGGRRYDCIVGVSGGVDSSFVAILVTELGLRPLAVHLDNGWDAELAVRNIQRVVEALGIDLYTHVIEWEEFRDLQVAFLAASTPDSEIPTDHAIAAVLRQAAIRERVRYVLSGANFRTETHLPRAWSRGHDDWRYIRSVNKRHGKGRLRSFPHTSLPNLILGPRIRWISVLDYVQYDKAGAMAELTARFGWTPYAGKHHESVYTRFYQGHLLPTKFGFDKRRCHFSSLICSGQMDRSVALRELQGPPYPLDEQLADRNYVLKRLRMTEESFGALLAAPKATIHAFDNYERYFKTWHARLLRATYRFFRRGLGMNTR